jgi:tetratricopeptide (TPR) repeat protein
MAPKDLSKPTPATAEEEDCPLAVATCSACGTTVESSDPDKIAVRYVFGEAFCFDCFDRLLPSARKASQRHKKALGKIEKAPSRRLKVKNVGLAELARDFASEPETAPSPRHKPPPLPRRIFLRLIFASDELQHIDKLLDRERQGEATAMVQERTGCTEHEAADAIEAHAATRPEAAPRGILGFARSLGRSTKFYMNVTFRKWDRVIEDGEPLLEKDPENLYLLATLGEAHAASQNTDRAEQLLRKVIDADEGAERPLALLAELLWKQRSHDLALPLFQRLEAIRPSSFEVQERLWECCLATKNLKAALAPLEALARLDPDRRLHWNLEHVEILYRLRRFARALSELSLLSQDEAPPYDQVKEKVLRVLEAQPQNVRGLSLAARLCENREEWLGSMRYYVEYLEKTPDSLKTLRKCARIAERLGRFGEAIWYHNLVLENSPELSRSRRRLVKLLLQAGEIDEALAHLDIFLQENPRDLGATRRKAEILLDAKEYERVEELLASFDAEKLVSIRTQARQAAATDRIVTAITGPGLTTEGALRLGEAFLERDLPDLGTAFLMVAAAGEGDVGHHAVEALLHIAPNEPQERDILLFLDSVPDKTPPDFLDRLLDYRGRNPSDGKVNRLLLRLLMEKERHDDTLALAVDLLAYGEIYAEDIFSTCETMQAKNVRAPRLALCFGHLYRIEGELWKASRYLADYVKKMPRDRATIETLVDLARKMGDAASLVIWLEKLQEIIDTPASLSLELARVGLEIQAFESALARVRTVLEADPTNVTAAELETRIRDRMNERRIATVLQTLADDPGDVGARFSLGKLYVENRDFERATKAFSGCASDKKHGQEAREMLFDCYQRLGRPKRALVVLQEMRLAQKIDARSKEGRAHLFRMADLYLDLDMPGRAGKLFFDILKVDPNYEGVKKKMSEVEVLEEISQCGKGPPSPDWFFETDGKAAGPYTLGDIHRRIAQGGLTAGTRVWRHGFSTWKKASKADKIAILFSLTRRRAQESPANGE